jgi:hypothetical protein
MNKLREFTPAVLEQIRGEINAALKPIQEKYGLKSLEARGGTYDSKLYTTKIQARLDGLSANDEMWCEIHDFPQDAFGKTISMNGRSFTISHIEHTRKKYPIACDNPDGKVTLFTIEGVKRALLAAAQKV